VAADERTDSEFGPEVEGDLTELLGSDLVRSAQTKLLILSRLRDRRSTGAELAKMLDVDRSAVYRHLADLDEGGYVERQETGRKWIYYELTSKGKTLARASNHLFKISVLFALGGVLGYLILRWLAALWTWEPVTRDVGPYTPRPEFPLLPVLSVLALGLIVLLVSYLRRRWNTS